MDAWFEALAVVVVFAVLAVIVGCEECSSRRAPEAVTPTEPAHVLAARVWAKAVTDVDHPRIHCSLIIGDKYRCDVNADGTVYPLRCVGATCVLETKR